ncbi:DNA-directed RNA polymerase subunit beta [Sporosarcina sp. YIM B06819]|uniref:DNA-directed RNA polymerase subunit beta n=1 Tax=Sporosarcina sp. YIM B06819 TaxID=3081769 RepID=UPI00298D3407|nr:DNA-directed RNA polymerase subunit beta [Sporosarcina sp. YIM B06819]
MTDEKRSSLKRQEDESVKTTTRTRSSRSEHSKRSTEIGQATPPKQLWVQIRLLPIWLRVILVLLLLVGAAILGAIIGYGYIGDGEPTDVLKKETWTHIIDIISGKESN